MNLFFSTPISGFNDPIAYSDYRKLLLDTVHTLKEHHNVFSEIENISELSFYDEPGKSAVADFAKIAECDVFILHHPKRMQTSSMIELGYAIAKEKKIVIIANRQDLPFLALGIVSSFTNVELISEVELTSDTATMILACLDSMS